MANGNVEQLANFLGQLPQLVDSRRRLQLQQERLDFSREQAEQDRLFQQERINLARQGAEEDRLYRQGIADRNNKSLQIQEFNQVYNNATDDVKRLLIKNHPLIKNNPELVKTFQENFDREDSLQDRIYELNSLEPSARQDAIKNLYKEKGLSSANYTTLKNIEKSTMDEVTFTRAEELQTSFGSEIQELETILKNPMATYNQIPASSGTTLQQYLNNIQQQLNTVRAGARKEYEESFGAYPTVEGIRDADLDSILRDTGVDTDNLEDLEKGIDSEITAPPAETTEEKPSPAVDTSFVKDDEVNKRLEGQLGSYETNFNIFPGVPGAISPLEAARMDERFEDRRPPIRRNLSREQFRAMKGFEAETDRLFGQMQVRASYQASPEEINTPEYANAAENLRKLILDGVDYYRTIDPSTLAGKNLRKSLKKQIEKFTKIAKSAYDKEGRIRSRNNPFKGDTNLINDLEKINL